MVLDRMDHELVKQLTRQLARINDNLEKINKTIEALIPEQEMSDTEKYRGYP